MFAAGRVIDAVGGTVFGIPLDRPENERDEIVGLMVFEFIELRHHIILGVVLDKPNFLNLLRRNRVHRHCRFLPGRRNGGQDGQRATKNLFPYRLLHCSESPVMYVLTSTFTSRRCDTAWRSSLLT